MEAVISTAAGHAIFIEEDPNQKYVFLNKSYAPIAYESRYLHTITAQDVYIR